MIIRAYLNSLLSLVKSGLIYCAAAVQVAGAKKWDVSRPSIGTLGNYSSLILSQQLALKKSASN